uniref:Uncharacterized protein n=1 Tax=Oryza meridionalis TaxID=40149 RepID=A0A0E0E055_9ORYZ
LPKSWAHLSQRVRSPTASVAAVGREEATVLNSRRKEKQSVVTEALVVAELAIPTVKSPARNSTSSPNPSLAFLLGRIDRAPAGVGQPLAGFRPLRRRRGVSPWGSPAAVSLRLAPSSLVRNAGVLPRNRHAVAVLSTIKVRHNEDCRRDRATVDTGGSERGAALLQLAWFRTANENILFLDIYDKDTL